MDYRICANSPVDRNTYDYVFEFIFPCDCSQGVIRAEYCTQPFMQFDTCIGATQDCSSLTPCNSRRDIIGLSRNDTREVGRGNRERSKRLGDEDYEERDERENRKNKGKGKGKGKGQGKDKDKNKDTPTPTPTPTPIPTPIEGPTISAFTIPPPTPFPTFTIPTPSPSFFVPPPSGNSPLCSMGCPFDLYDNGCRELRLYFPTREAREIAGFEFSLTRLGSTRSVREEREANEEEEERRMKEERGNVFECVPSVIGTTQYRCYIGPPTCA